MSLVDDDIESEDGLKEELNSSYGFFKNKDRKPSNYEIHIYNTLKQYTKSSDPVILVDLSLI